MSVTYCIADIPGAIRDLELELAEHVERRKHMKAVNAYFKKHGTLTACPDLSIQQTWDLMEHSVRLPGTPPYLSFELANNNRKIRYLREQIRELERLQENPAMKDYEKRP